MKHRGTRRDPVEDEVLRMLGEGVTPLEISQRMPVKQARVYRIIERANARGDIDKQSMLANRKTRQGRGHLRYMMSNYGITTGGIGTEFLKRTTPEARALVVQYMAQRGYKTLAEAALDCLLETVFKEANDD